MSALSRALFVFYSIIASFSILAADDLDNYRLSVDDKVSVTVFNEPDLSVREINVGTNGTVSLPLIGQVAVKDLTVSEAEQIITFKLLDGYLKKPNVSVSITEYRPFYINGEVKRPGAYPFRKGLTIEKAVTLAGGFTERASKSTITLISENDKRFQKAVSLLEPIKPGDQITVSESFF